MSHISKLLELGKPSISFEFFPPKTAEGADKLFEHITELEALKPNFVSVTYGAGGSTRTLTHDLVLRILKETELVPVPHLTCVKHSKKEITEILTQYAYAGISNVLALRGDPPKEVLNYDRLQDAFPYAEDLVEYIKDFNDNGSHSLEKGFGIGVAGFPEGHPETPNRLHEMDYLKAKVDAGADYICTQLFFDNHDFFDYRDRCSMAGIDIPIIAGIMPVTSRKGMIRMAELAAGARYPARLLKHLEGVGEGENITAAGIEYATVQCQELMNEQVAGLHFYTLNKSQATREIVSQIG